MNSSIEKVRLMMETWEDHPYDACKIIFDMISDEQIDEPWIIIKEVLSNPKAIGNKKAEPKEISRDELNRLSYRYRDYLTKLVEMLSMKDVEEDAFYQELYTLVFDSDIIPENRENRAFYLCELIYNVKLIPYYRTEDLVKFKDEEFKSLYDSLALQLDRAYHMCYRKFDTKSERVSQYWRLASELKTREEQIVFLTVVIEMEKDKEKKEEKN